MKESTVVDHLERLSDDGMDIDLRPILPPAEKVGKTTRTFEEMGGEFLKPIKELLGDDYSYDEIKMVRIFLRQQGILPE